MGTLEHLIFLTISLVTYGVEAGFTSLCDLDSKTITVQYINDGMSATFVFATGKLSTCSRGSPGPVFMGNGTVADPYTLNITVTESAQTTACGVVLTDSDTETYEFSVEAKFGPAENINSPNDVIENIQCVFNPPPTRPLIVAQYACDAQRRLHFVYFNDVATPVDIYSVDKRSTCGMAAGVGTGNVTSIYPFHLTIDLSGATQTPACGVQELSTDVFRVNIIVQSTANILKADDVIYSVQCNFSEPFTELTNLDTGNVTVGLELTDGTASVLEGKASLQVTDEDGARVSTVSLGQKIKLQVDLTTTDAEGLRVTKCVARPSRFSTIDVQLLKADGCAEGDLMGPFSSISGNQAKTSAFEAFRFDSAASLVFVCQLDFCYDATKTGCVGTHCHERLKRDVITTDQEEVSATVLFQDYKATQTAAISGNITNSKVEETLRDATEQCNQRLFWVILGCLLGIILILTLATACVFFYFWRQLRRKKTTS